MGGGTCFSKRGGYTLHTEYYERKYITSNFCSWAFIFYVFVMLTLIILPFVLTFSIGSKKLN